MRRGSTRVLIALAAILGVAAGVALLAQPVRSTRFAVTFPADLSEAHPRPRQRPER